MVYESVFANLLSVRDWGKMVQQCQLLYEIEFYPLERGKCCFDSSFFYY